MATILDGVWTNRIDVEMGTTYGLLQPTMVQIGQVMSKMAIHFQKQQKLTKM